MTPPAAGRNERGMALGKQMTLEYYDCDPAILADAKGMEELFVRAARESGATVIESCFHPFEPQGVSGMVIISESHFAVHAWPEFDYAAVDLFTCGDNVDFACASELLRKGLHSAGMIVSSVMNRGVVGNNGLERLVPVFEDGTSRFALSWRARFEGTQAWGMLATIDVYEVHAALFAGADPAGSIEVLMHKLMTALELPSDGYLHCKRFSGANGDRAFCWECGLFSLHARFRNETKTIYFDLFNNAYFDPRMAAECLMRCLTGSHYRMQVFIRQ